MRSGPTHGTRRFDPPRHGPTVALLMALIFIVPVQANTSYLGVFRSGKGSNGLYQMGSWKDFVAKWKEMNHEHGQKLMSLEVIAPQTFPKLNSNVPGYVSISGIFNCRNQPDR